MTTVMPPQRPGFIYERSRILVVEDDPGFLKVLNAVFSRTYDVTQAKDGVIAAHELTHNVFDLVLTDINLPGMTGIELLRVVRSYDLDVPIILMTGDPRLETALQAIELGALGYILKPVELEVLEKTISRAVTLGQLARIKREALSISNGAESGNSLLIGDKAGLSVRFRQALGNLKLHFQPIVDSYSKEIVAYEALMRSDDPTLPNPGAVIDAAERLKTIPILGRKIRELAAEAISRLPDNTLLFVNVHSQELLDEGLFKSCPMQPHAKRIVLEITERASFESINDVARRINELRNFGFRIAVDDLGAGYAGLNSFVSLEPDYVKIDMSLIRGIENHLVKQRVVNSIIHLCRELSMTVIAEGIETPEEHYYLTNQGCDYVQGYFLGRPDPVFKVS